MASTIRIGFIGLSTTGYWAASAHLPYLLQSQRYTITALCNSSVASAEAARDKFKLPASTKCYGSPSEIAADPDVDLVVCSVRVDKHYDVLRPALEAGKDVFCEWPLAANLQEAEELASLARQKGCRTMVGLQARRDPFILALKSMVESRRIGDLLSSNVYSAAGTFGATMNESLRYLLEKETGGNMLTIHFAHMLDSVLFALGELVSFNGSATIQRPDADILARDGKKTGTMIRETFDHIMLHGILKKGAVLNVELRGGPPFKGEPALTWRIYGNKGEILITAGSNFLQQGPSDLAIRLHDHSNDSVKDVDWAHEGPEKENFDNLAQSARNVARMYEAWAGGKDELFINMDEAVERHKLLDKLVQSSETGSRRAG